MTNRLESLSFSDSYQAMLRHGRWLVFLWFAGFVSLNALAAELPFARLNSSNRLTPLPTDSTTAMVFDKYGHLWLGIYSSGVGYYTGADLKVFNKEHGLDYLLVDALTIDDAGYLWVGTDHGLAISTAPVEAAYRGEAFAFQSKFPGTEIPVGTITAGPMAGIASWPVVFRPQAQTDPV